MRTLNREHRSDEHIGVEVEAGDALEALFEVRLDAQRVLCLGKNLEKFVVWEKKETRKGEPAAQYKDQSNGQSHLLHIHIAIYLSIYLSIQPELVVEKENETCDGEPAARQNVTSRLLLARVHPIGLTRG